MKRRIGLVITLGLLTSLLTFAQAYATHRDAFTFFIPYHADSLAEYFRTGGQRPAGFTVNGVENVISISVMRSDSVIYYDQWEDELEPNILFPSQTSTQVWGDGDQANGFPPNIPGDILSAGDVITLQNVVASPRNPAELFFDGGDKITSVGGAIAVTLAAWPQPDGDILFAGAWELYPTSRWGTNYVIPVGENVPRRRGGFTIVGLNVQAVEDGTSVQLDLDADGFFENTVVLNEGGQFAEVSGVMAGAQVQASAPVQVHLFTKDPRSTWEARAYTLLPRDQWADDYLAPRSSDGDYWLYNPNSTDLEVQVETTAGITNIPIQANNVGRFPLGAAQVLNFRTGARFTSTDGRPFYGLAALDEDQAQDWGYALLPVGDLTTQALVGWAPGNDRTPPSSFPGDSGRRASRVYVTAPTDTTVFVDFEGNGTRTATFPVSALEERDIVDDVDFDMTGARLFTTDGVPFIAVWGQDQDAPPADPSIDLGTNIVPLRAPSIQKGYSIIQEAYNCGTVSQRNIVRFQLQAFNDSNVPVPGAVIGDTLPAGVTYRPGTTMVVGGNPIPDDGSGSPFPLDEGGFNVGDIPELGVVSITYEAFIDDVGVFTNQAEFISPPADPASVDLLLPFRVASFEVAKTLVDPSGGLVTPGQVITFNVTITNTGSAAITMLPLRDEFDENLLTFRSASILPDAVAPGEITWSDLTAAGDLPPNTPVTVLVSLTVNDPIPPGAISTINVALAEGAQSSDGRTQAIVCGDASVSFAEITPTPTPTLTPTPTSTPTTATPTPRTSTPTSRTATPTPVSVTPTSPVATPTSAVLFLPETGVDSSTAVPLWPLAVLPGLGLLVGWAIYRHRGKWGR